MAKRKLKLKGDFQGDVQEDIAILDVGKIKVKNAPRKPKVKDKFQTTDDSSGLPLGDLIVKPKGTRKIKWKYNLDNDDPRVQALAAGEQVTETYKIIVKARGAKKAKHKFTVIIAGENDAPEITSDGGGANAAINVDENRRVVTTVTAHDVDHGANVSFSIVGGVDQAFFDIDANTGDLVFLLPPDFETKLDDGGDNTYEVIVRADDGLGGVDEQTITVQVRDVTEIDLSASTTDETIEELDGTSKFIKTGSGNDNIVVGPGNDSIFSGPGNDNVMIGDGDDIVNAGPGDDTVVAGQGGGDDVIDGSTGTDTVIYPSSNQDLTIDLRPQDHSATAATGNATVGTLLVNAGYSATLSVGLATGLDIGTDVLINIENATGGDGDDTFIGNASDNVLDGATGNDQVLYQESVLGYDIVIGGGTATVTDTDPSNGDTGEDTLIAMEQAVFPDVTVLLDGTNNNPFTVPDQFITDEDTAITFARSTLLANDREFDGDVMTIISLDTSGTTGTAVLNPDGTTITYDPNGQFDQLLPAQSAEDSFLYTVADGNGGIATGTATVTVAGVLHVANLDGVNGFRVDGINAGDFMGVSVSAAGDVNGDGHPDLIIGADGASQSYVLFGGESAFSGGIDLSALDGSNGFVIVGGGIGGAVSGAGDVNGDGFDDLILGAPDFDTTVYGQLGGGATYVVFGQSSGFSSTLDLATLDGNNGGLLFGFILGGVTGSYLSGAGDINGDGYDEFLAGPGAWIKFGSDTADYWHSSNQPGDPYPYGVSDLDAIAHSGGPVSGIGDFNGDSYDDFVIGGMEPITGERQAYVVFGAAGVTAEDFQGPDYAFDGNNGFVFHGLDGDDLLGSRVSGAGDINGDGYDDVIIGGGTDANFNLKAAYVVFGGPGRAYIDVYPDMLDGSNGFAINLGDGAYESLASVSSAGDFNGDGYDDLIISASAADFDNAAEAYVVFGKLNGFSASLDVTALDGSDGFVLRGENVADLFGDSISGAGDLNGDGYDDIIVGALGVDPDGRENAGASYIVFGGDYISDPGTPVPPDGPVGPVFQARYLISDIASGSTADLAGVTFDGGGESVSGAGDINDDGYADLIIGDSGASQSYVLFGGASALSASLDPTALDGSNGFILAGEAIGDAVSGAGDVNGDGFDDLVLGAWDFDTSALGEAGGGASYIVFGKDWGFSSLFDLGTLNGSNGALFFGTALASLTGLSVSGAVDINGDGFDEVLIGGNYGTYLFSGEFSDALTGDPIPLDSTPNIDASGGFSGSLSGVGDFNGDGYEDFVTGVPTASGEAYVIFGKEGFDFANTLNVSALDGNNGFIFHGLNEDDFAGHSVSGGDINGDGYDDLIVGGTNAAYVVFGGPGRAYIDVYPDMLDGSDGFVINAGQGNYDDFSSVSSAGDFNGDGYDDLVIGADLAGTDYVGEVYLVFGKQDGFSASLDVKALDGSEGFVLSGVNLADHTGASVSGAGDLNGDGYDDIIIGAYGAENFTGASYIVFGGEGTHSGKPPVITSNGGGVAASVNVDENSTAVTTVVATDADGTTLTYSIVGGTDGASFQINGATGLLSFITAPDFEAPHDIGIFSGNDNAYEVMVRASDGTLFDEQTITVNVQNVIDSIDLATFTSVAGFRIFGADTGDFSGSSVSSAGDVNGDGFADVIIGAAHADASGNAKISAGESYVVFGKTSGFADVDLATLAIADGFHIFGADAGDFSGSSVSSAGDVNGDGFADLIIGAQFADASGNAKISAGESYVIFGKASGFADIDLAALSPGDGFVINGLYEGGFAGKSVSSAGDVNGDGFDDLIIGAPGVDFAGTDAGEAYVIFGAPNGNGGIFILEAAPELNSEDHTGISVSGAGDINGDGLDDLIVGASYADVFGVPQAGKSYVVFGDPDFNDTEHFLELSTLDGSNGFVVTDFSLFDYSGQSVSGAGDVNGDGFADVIISAPFQDGGQSDVIFGKASGFAALLDLSTLSASDGFRIFGADADDDSGVSVSSAGDINGDGFSDLIVGAYLGDASGNAKSAAGESYVIFGKASGFTDIDLAALSASDGFRIFGADADDFSGTSVSSAGDVNGDGFDDLIIGAPAADASGNTKIDAGESYVLFGAALGASDTPVNTVGDASAEIFIGALGDDTLVGGGGADVFHAGAGDDTITASDFTFAKADGGSGVDTLVLEGSGVTFDFTTLADTKTEGIEVVDFTGSGNNTLKLGVTDAINLSDELNFDFSGVVDAPKAVVIEGDTGDTLELAPDTRGAWALQASDVNLDGSASGPYDVWSFQVGPDHFIKLAVDHDVGVTLL